MPTVSAEELDLIMGSLGDGMDSVDECRGIGRDHALLPQIDGLDAFGRRASIGEFIGDVIAKPVVLICLLDQV